MIGKALRPRRRSSGIRVVVAACAVLAWGGTDPHAAVAADDARAPGSASLLNDVLESLDFKAKPAGPAPDFIEKTRPDPSGLHYVPQPVPHAVSPVTVKTPAQIEAKKAALDAAQVRQLQPAPPPLDLTKKVRAGTAAKSKSTVDAD